ncbi:MAG: SGNH/GDSL hydrolase family protein [Alteraurantiacibacter sp.]
MSITTRLAISAAALALSSPLCAQDNWVASWTASPHAPLGSEGPFAAAEYEDVTISQVLRLSEGGDRLKVRLTNRYGDRPLTIGQARIVLLDADGVEVEGTSRPLTFGGEAGAVVPRGAPFETDTVMLDTADFDKVKVEFYLSQATGPCTCHLTGLDTLAVSAPGNHVGEAWEPASTSIQRAFPSVVEVASDDALGTIVTYGDSITDGAGSTPGKDRRWPDVLAQRLEAAGLEYAVANAGISGNRVLSPGMGESALARLDEDVLSLPNVTHMIVFVGVNDIGNRFGGAFENPDAGPLGGLQLDQPDIDAEQLIAGFRQIIARAQDEGIMVIGSPIGPYKGAAYWTDEGEAVRQTVNDWIVNSGEFDGVIRLDIAFADPADPQAMRDGYHMGDFLHGSDAGLRAAANTIDLTLFQPD